MKFLKVIGIVGLVTIALALVIKLFLPASDVSNNNPAKKIPVYFVKTVNNKDSELVSVQRGVIKAEKLVINVALKELLDGPNGQEKAKGYLTEIPKETKLLGIQNGKEGIIINLSRDFESGGGSESMVARLKQLIYTATENTDKPVYLELNGSRVKYIGGEGVEVPQPLKKELIKNPDV